MDQEKLTEILSLRLERLRELQEADRQAIKDAEPKGKERNGEGMKYWYKFSDRKKESIQVLAYKIDEVKKVGALLGVKL